MYDLFKINISFLKGPALLHLPGKMQQLGKPIRRGEGKAIHGLSVPG